MPTDDPTIRPLPGDAPEPRPPARWHPWLAIATAVAGVVVGLLIGLDIGSDPEVPPTVAGTLSSLPPDLAGPGFVDPTTTTTTTTTLPPASTTTTTRADPQPPPSLGEMVPGLDGTMLVAQPGDPGLVLRWRVDEPWPELFALPANTTWAAFDASGDWVAALSMGAPPFRSGGTLHLAGRDLVPQPFDSGVTTFHWHPTARGGLAWTRATLDGRLELWSGAIPGPAEDLRRVASFDEAGEGDRLGLAAWGDWGYALAGIGDAGDQRLVTLDRDGERLAERTADLWGASVDGTLLVSLPDEETGLSTRPWLVGPTLADPREVEWQLARPVLWSPDGTRVASVTPGALGAVLQIAGEGELQSVIDSEFATPVAWTPGDRFLVSLASGVRTRFSADLRAPAGLREVRRSALVFTDLSDRSSSAIAVDGPVSDVAFRVAS